MSKWRVTLECEIEVEAEDEGDALMQADSAFSVMRDGRAEEICEEGEGEAKNG